MYPIEVTEVSPIEKRFDFPYTGVYYADILFKGIILQTIILLASWKMKKCMFLLVIVFVIATVSCDLHTTNNTPDIIPQVTTLSTRALQERVAIAYSEGPKQDKISFIANTPLLQRFESNSGLNDGDSYSIECLNSTMVFDIILQEDGSYLFEGTLEDGSGWLNVEYDPLESIFSFQQGFYANLTFTDEDSNTADIDAFVYSEGTDIEIDSSGYFHGWTNSGYVLQSLEGTEFTSMSTELYRGIMNSTGDVGTGVALFSDGDSDPETGTRFYQGVVPEELSVPEEISTDTISEWAFIFASDEVAVLDAENDFSEGYWEILYYLDEGDEYIRVSDNTVDDSTLTGFEDGFTDEGDLSNWEADSLILSAFSTGAE